MKPQEELQKDYDELQKVKIAICIEIITIGIMGIIFIFLGW